jgi:transcriptional regulator
MYVPPEYNPADPVQVQELVSGYPLALLSTNGVDTPYATHVPVIIRKPGTADGGLLGATLVGHMNRANPHWAALAGGVRALLVFAGPHGYVSPTVYGITPAAPTWNFTSVHVRGALQSIEDRPASLGIVVATVRAFESRFGRSWDMRPSLDYFRRILPGVGAFTVQVDRVEALFKLSQEQTPEVRQRVVRSFASGTGCELAKLMRQSDQHPASGLTGE